MFDFESVHDNDIADLTELLSETVQSFDGELGHISHLLIGPTTDRAEWAVVVDASDQHHLVPVDLLDLDEKEDLVLRLIHEDVKTHFIVGDPEDLSPHLLTDAARNGLAHLLKDSTSGVVRPYEPSEVVANIDQTMLLGGGSFEVHSLQDLAASLTSAPPPAATPAAPADVVQPGRSFDPSTSAGHQTWPGHSASHGPNTSHPPTGGHPPASTTERGSEAVRDDPSDSSERYMLAELPKKVHVNKRFSVQVQVNETVPTGANIPLSGLVAGSIVTVNVTVPESFQVDGERTQEIHIPESGNSPPILFSFTPKAEGTFAIRLTAFAGGTYLGELHSEVSVGVEAGGTAPVKVGTLSAVGPRPGEVSLKVTYDDATRTFRFTFVAGGEWRELPSAPMQGDLQARIETVIAELDLYARSGSGLSEAETQQRIRIRGFELWRDLVPPELRNAIFDHLDDITQLTIISDRELVPWELLYPQSQTGEEPGFLVSLFPVNRWVMAKPWQNQLSLTNPEFVVPANSPSQASDEVSGIGRLLRATAPVSVQTKQQLLASITDPSFDVLHFACHNTFEAGGGSQITFPDAPFEPKDLALHAASTPLADKGSLIFINACRTQGTSPVYTTFDNWAKTFLDLGATAVIGTSWAVRDRTARPFAEAVYERLTAGDSLGQSVAAARTRVSTTIGDPTWLAYTVYGDPHAKVATP
jgi:hypothetical protein